MTETERECSVCKFPIQLLEVPDYESGRGRVPIEFCSEFCDETKDTEKTEFLNMKEGDFGFWPCTDCGHIIEDAYVPNGCCSQCHKPRQLRALQAKLDAAEKLLEKQKEETAVWKKEAEAAYKYNKEINRWWQFKLERAAAEAAHQTKNVELDRALTAIREHRDQKGHDRCWLDDQKLYSVLPEGGEYNSKLPPRLEFLKNCERFYDSRQGDCPKLHEWGDSEIEKKRQWALRWKKFAKHQRNKITDMKIMREASNSREDKLVYELHELYASMNSPVTENFIQGMQVEIEHQRKRWKQTDPQKTDADWFWLIGYLAGKALLNPGGDLDKKKHRVITVAAAAANWFSSLQ